VDIVLDGKVVVRETMRNNKGEEILQLDISDCVGVITKVGNRDIQPIFKTDTLGCWFNFGRTEIVEVEDEGEPINKFEVICQQF